MATSEFAGISQPDLVLAGGDEMGQLMRAHDWAATPIGPVEGWPSEFAGRCENGQDWAMLSVQDSGLGIREDDLGLIFQRFGRGANVEHIAGSGIGLVYVKDVATQHGGTVSVNSTRGQGSTFTLLLPLR